MAIRVAFVGLGPIGCGVVRQAASRRGFKIVGAVDVDPAKAGRDLGLVAGLERRLGVEVGSELRRTLEAAKADVVALCTSSSLKKVAPQLEAILKLRLPIVSTTEELAYPWRTQRALARRIDAAARKARVGVLGTGVNPGFAMDALPIALSAVCESVTEVHVDRVQDARIRRLPFQKKIGSGLRPAEFEELVKAGSVRHVGLSESVSMIADALGFKIERITDEIRPKLAEAEVASEFLKVKPGEVCGIVQDGRGFSDGKPVVVLHMEAYLGAPESYDEVRLVGNPPLRFRAVGGIHGDVATAAIVLNSMPKLLAAPPGLHSMRTLALPSFAR
jgi:4-hydroxy-tetrahydrodipicolinate reductase